MCRLLVVVLLFGALLLLLDAKATGGKHKRHSGNPKTKRVVPKKQAGSGHKYHHKKGDIKDFNLDEDDDDDEEDNNKKDGQPRPAKAGLDISNNPDAILAAGRLRYAIQESLGKLARAETDMHNALTNQAQKAAVAPPAPAAPDTTQLRQTTRALHCPAPCPQTCSYDGCSPNCCESKMPPNIVERFIMDPCPEHDCEQAVRRYAMPRITKVRPRKQAQPAQPVTSAVTQPQPSNQPANAPSTQPLQQSPSPLPAKPPSTQPLQQSPSPLPANAPSTQPQQQPSSKQPAKSPVTQPQQQLPPSQAVAQQRPQPNLGLTSPLMQQQQRPQPSQQAMSSPMRLQQRPPPNPQAMIQQQQPQPSQPAISPYIQPPSPFPQPPFTPELAIAQSQATHTDQNLPKGPQIPILPPCHNPDLCGFDVEPYPSTNVILPPSNIELPMAPPVQAPPYLVPACPPSCFVQCGPLCNKKCCIPGVNDTEPPNVRDAAMKKQLCPPICTKSCMALCPKVCCASTDEHKVDSPLAERKDATQSQPIDVPAASATDDID